MFFTQVPSATVSFFIKNTYKRIGDITINFKPSACIIGSKCYFVSYEYKNPQTKDLIKENVLKDSKIGYYRLTEGPNNGFYYTYDENGQIFVIYANRAIKAELPNIGYDIPILPFLEEERTGGREFSLGPLLFHPGEKEAILILGGDILVRFKNEKTVTKSALELKEPPFSMKGCVPDLPEGMMESLGLTVPEKTKSNAENDIWDKAN